MALNIPMPDAPDIALGKAFTQGTGLYNMLMQHAIQRAQSKRMDEQNQRAAEMQPYNIKKIESAIANANAANARQQALLSPRLQAFQDAHGKFLQESDPTHKAKQFRAMIAALSGMNDEQTNKPMKTDNLKKQLQSMGMFGNKDSELDGQGMFPLSEEEQMPEYPIEKESKNQKSSLTPEQVKRAAAKSAFGIDLLKPDKEGAYQGIAREAYDLERLRKNEGEDSEVYRTAKGLLEAKKQNYQDLNRLRERTIGGLKPGEKWILDPQTGEHIGIESKMTPKEINREIGRNLFNELYPIVYNGAGELSGEGSINKIQDWAANYKNDPVKRKKFDDLLLAEKALTAAVVNEAATLDAGKTNQTYNRLNESLKASDVPKKIKELIKQFGIPAEAQIKAGLNWQRLLSKAQQNATKRVPATRKLYYDPDKQFGSNNTSFSDRDPSSMTQEEIEQELAQLESGGQ